MCTYYIHRGLPCSGLFTTVFFLFRCANITAPSSSVSQFGSFIDDLILMIYGLQITMKRPLFARAKAIIRNTKTFFLGKHRSQKVQLRQLDKETAGEDSGTRLDEDGWEDDELCAS